MEEQQIQDFVSRVSSDENLRNELANDPDTVIARENFSPRVAQVIIKMVPHLAFGSGALFAVPLYWWSR